MDDTAKYLIHASITADGVVERSDVVGAIFGQTEGLLGDELDLRDLQQSSKVGRIDVEIESENGQSFGHVTIASSLDKVETSILAASLETITRVGPCKAAVSVTDIEDVREAKRREVVERAKELLASSFDDSIMTSAELLEEVRESVRVENISEYHGLPAGPHVADSDAIVVVEGRADVLTLLKYGIKNAVAVEGTNVPDTVAELTRERTVTAFLDGDRGGELILRELTQVGDVDYVAFAPEGRSVEDLSREEVMTSLREKTSYDALPEDGSLRAAVGRHRTDDGVTDPPRSAPQTTENGSAAHAAATAEETEADAETDGAGVDAAAATAGESPQSPAAAEDENSDAGSDGSDGSGEESANEAAAESANDEPPTLAAHVAAVIGDDTGTVRLLGPEWQTFAEGDADETYALLDAAEVAPHAVVLDGALTQRVLDVAAQRGVDHLVAREEGEFVKKPLDVRVRTAAAFGD